MRVLITGGLLDDDRLLYRAELEGFEVFPKPYDASEFLEKVRSVLSGRQAEHIRSTVEQG